MNGPPSFPSLDELLERTMRFNPSRSRSSLRRGILHNAEQQPDGTWVWRWAKHRSPEASPAQASPEETAARGEQLWAALTSAGVPVLLARGMRPDSVLGDEDEEELRKRLASAEIVHMPDAGHSVQGDMPLELAALIERFVFGS